ncbi:protein MIS12 homolog, partial [Stegodyphus dumicola]|uniref:protein MIS12 homolog n=1 Tax=Stegodyphus dumicola TaxID=202533 RepID=UPI0015AB6079
MDICLDYETQYFLFHPRIFIDGVYNAFYENIFNLLDDLKQFLTDEFANVIEPFNVAIQTDSVLRELVKRLDKAIDKLEVYLIANVFKIPKYVVLKEDTIHITNPVTKSDEKKLDDEIKELKHQILETTQLNLTVTFYDVETAYLYSDLNEDVYMTPPTGYEQPTGEGK